MKRLAMIMASLAILWMPGPVFSDPLELETFHGPKGDYNRLPSGYRWEDVDYRFVLRIPEIAEGCADAGIVMHQSPVLGPVTAPCLKVFEDPVVSIYVGYHDRIDLGGLQELIRSACQVHRAFRTSMVIDGKHFLRCRRQSQGPRDYDKVIEYFTLKRGEEFHVSTYCPARGDCRQWEKRWVRAVFTNLYLNWQMLTAFRPT